MIIVLTVGVGGGVIIILKQKYMFFVVVVVKISTTRISLKHGNTIYNYIHAK